MHRAIRSKYYHKPVERSFKSRTRFYVSRIPEISQTRWILKPQNIILAICNHQSSADPECDADVLESPSNLLKPSLSLAMLVLGSVSLAALSRPLPCLASSNMGAVAAMDKAPRRFDHGDSLQQRGRGALREATLLASLSLSAIDVQRTGYQVQKVGRKS